MLSDDQMKQHDDLLKQNADELERLRHLLDDIDLSHLSKMMDETHDELIALMQKNMDSLDELMDRLRSM